MKHLIPKALLGSLLLAGILSSAAAKAETIVLLDANFNDKPLNAPIGTGGPNVGEPIFVHPAVDAKVQATPGPSPSLHIGKLSGTSYDSVVFEFPGSVEATDGELRVGFSVRAPASPSNFLFGISEQGNATSNFGKLQLTSVGDIVASDASGGGIVRTYAPDETLVVEYLYHLEASTYDLRINNVLLLSNRAHGVTNPAHGIGRLFIATNQTTKWIVDDVSAINTTPTFLGSNYGPIPDGLGVGIGRYGASRDIRFSFSGVPGTVSTTAVSFSAAHDYVGDLRVRLIAPNGKQHLLFERTGARSSIDPGFGSNLVAANTYAFEDSNITNWWTAASAISIPSTNARTVTSGGDGTANPPPVTSMNASFAATPVNGTWILRFDDGNRFSEGSVSTATLTLLPTGVTRVVSSINDSGAGSLREAMTLAAVGDLITFDPVLFDMPQTIELSTALPNISGSMAIEGPGANLLTVRRRDGVENFRIFNVNTNSANVSISNMTISNGNSTTGGGIRSNGNLTLSRVVVSGNTATSEGGGVFAIRDVFIHASTIAGNRAGQGGGIAYEAVSGRSLRLYDSTVSGNRADSYGGILHYALDAGSRTLEVYNSTVAFNAARIESGGIGTYAQSSGTIATTTLRNSIVANNSPNNVVAFPDEGGVATTISSGYNLSDDWNGIALSSTDITGNPRLGPLAPQGGTTPTHLLLGGSAALDMGNRSGAANDQRGAPRAFDIASIANNANSDSADIGAVEMRAIIVTTAGDNGPGSLREAINTANANGTDLDDIIFDSSLFTAPQTIPLATELPHITSTMTLSGPGARQLTLRRNDSAPAFRLFTMAAGHLGAALSGMTITNGGFGGIYSGSDLALAEVALTSNISTGQSGGGLLAFDCNVFIIGSTISGNAAAGGGGVSFISGTGNVMRVVNSTVSGNSGGTRRGGALGNTGRYGDSRLEIINSTLAQNTATSGGGGIATETLGDGSSATTIVRNSIITDNTTPGLSALTFSGGGPATYVSRGFNLASDNSGAFLNLSTDQNNANAGLLPLADNGGPTFTHALTSISDALDGGNNSGSGVTASQRGPGYARTVDLPLTNVPGGDGTDVGAFEVQSDPDRIFANGFD